MTDRFALDLLETLAARRDGDHASDALRVAEGHQLAMLQLEVRLRDDLPAREDAGALHDVADLARIARPRMLPEQRLRVLVQYLRRRAAPHGHLVQELLGDRNDVHRPESQRGQLDPEHVEPEEQVAPEPA